MIGEVGVVLTVEHACGSRKLIHTLYRATTSGVNSSTRASGSQSVSHLSLSTYGTSRPVCLARADGSGSQLVSVVLQECHRLGHTALRWDGLHHVGERPGADRWSHGAATR